MARTQDSEPNETTAPDAAADDPTADNGPAEAQVQAKMDEETERGYRGVKVDPTPDEHYTVAGVTAGLPTPETDPDAHNQAVLAARLEGRFPPVQ